MDLQDFWQESKRWVLGVVAGAIVFWIGSGVVEATVGGRTAVLNALSTARSIKNGEWFDSDARDAARAENERLEQLAARVREHVAFVPDAEFVLPSGADADTYFPKMERLVRQRVLARAQEESVSLDEQSLSWPAPVDTAEKEARLIGLAVLQHGALRLLEASELVRQRDPEALGVQVIDSFVVETKPGAGSRGARRAAKDDASELFEEHRVKFQFHADVATLQAWLEMLRGREPSIGLQPDLIVTPGNQVGDPIRVTGTLSALVFPDAPKTGQPH